MSQFRVVLSPTACVFHAGRQHHLVKRWTYGRPVGRGLGQFTGGGVAMRDSLRGWKMHLPGSDSLSSELVQNHMLRLSCSLYFQIYTEGICSLHFIKYHAEENIHLDPPRVSCQRADTTTFWRRQNSGPTSNGVCFGWSFTRSVETYKALKTKLTCVLGISNTEKHIPNMTLPYSVKSKIPLF